MEERRFGNMDEMCESVASLLFDELSFEAEQPFAVMLSGGSTPLDAYSKLAAKKFKASKFAHILFCDERMVPYESPESNYGNISSMIDAINIPPNRIFRVNTAVSLNDAARLYNEKLDDFFAKDGHVTLGLLGMGADGHTASIFSIDDVRRGEGLWALDVKKASGLNRVSVTRDFLLKIEKIILLVGSKDKEEALRELKESPEETPVGAALNGCSKVSLWVA
jgi:6-phosphogluconolactonase/glucosamine-6-phosphate isomerase/deaminase